MTKHKIKEICSEIQDALGLRNWRLSYGWHDEDTDEEKGPAADIHVQPQYFEIRLNIYPRFFDSSDGHQFEILLHEFCHVLTEELYLTACAFAQGKNYHQESLEHSRERNTTMVSLAMLSILASESNKLGKTYKKLSFIKTHKKSVAPSK